MCLRLRLLDQDLALFFGVLCFFLCIHGRIFFFPVLVGAPEMLLTTCPYPLGLCSISALRAVAAVCFLMITVASSEHLGSISVIFLCSRSSDLSLWRNFINLIYWGLSVFRSESSDSALILNAQCSGRFPFINNIIINIIILSMKLTFLQNMGSSSLNVFFLSCPPLPVGHHVWRTGPASIMKVLQCLLLSQCQRVQMSACLCL